MRLIGHLPSEGSATRFSNFLYLQGISNLVEEEKDGWAVWVHAEEELERARDFLTGFLGNPDDPRFQKAQRQAREHRAQEESKQTEREKRFFDRGKVFRATIPYGVGPLTIFITVACVVATLVNMMNEDGSLRGALMISQSMTGLPEVRNGEVWRLLTPIFLHAPLLSNPLHLLCNVMWLLDLGSMIEGRQSTRKLLMLVLVIGVVSNVAQFLQSGPLFYGISGVNYGLLGYVWMKGKYDPSSGLFLHPQTIAMMLIWFVLCFTPVIPGIANTTHAVGLAMGVMWGLLSSLKARRA